MAEFAGPLDLAQQRAHALRIEHEQVLELEHLGLDLARHQLPQIFQVHMTRHELGERVGDRDDGFPEIAVLHARGTPE